MEKTCSCQGSQALIFACSGGSDVGALADLTARRLAKDGRGRMYCLAGIGGRVEGMMKTAKAAPEILAIDGCPADCAKKTLEEAGFKAFKHARLSEMGFEKGKSEVSDASVSALAESCGSMIGKA